MSEEVKKVKKPKVRNFYDTNLLAVLIFLCCFGLVMLYSSSGYTASLDADLNHNSFYYVAKQGAIMAGGLAAALLFSRMDYHLLIPLAPLAWIVSLVFMVLVDFTSFGREVNGEKRWFGIGSHNLFQPSELVKVAIIVCLAAYLVAIGKNRNSHPIKSGLLYAVILIPLDVLVLKSNLSTGIIIFGIAFALFFVTSRKKKFYIFAVAAAALAVVWVVKGGYEFLVDKGLLKLYQVERILVWLDPESYSLSGGYQVLQGLYAIGSGGWLGKGLGNSIQKLGFIPEAYNDYIFSIICEELGFFGAVGVIFLYGFMIWRLYVIARNAKDLFGSLLSAGVMAHISLQVMMNIAVVTNTMPNTGVTLPFISYGGTSILLLMAEMGIALSVSRQITAREV